ncbi:MAG: OmpA family protein [Myxococcales bacterium]|nr:OmpA family protein [Myxococcales bacterium]
MNSIFSVTAIAAALLLTPACHKATSGPSGQTSVAPRPTASRGVAPTPRATEVLSGDLRTAALLLQRIHFAYDSDELRPESRDALAQAGAFLAKHPTIQIYVDGHTDERGTTEYNIALGERRSQIVIAYLARLGVGADQLTPVSFGEEHPLRQGASADALASNRRVEFRLMRGDVQLVLEDGPRYADDGTPIAIATPRPGATAP